jgi:hypothetical protein
MSSVLSLAFRISNQNVVRIYYFLMHATCTTHANLLDLVILIIFVD